jgi:molybdate transport system permease protein
MDYGVVIQAVGLSLLCAVAAVLICLVPATGVALVLARRSFRGKALLEMMVMLPVVVPPVVTGYLLLIVLSRRGLLGPVLDVLGIQIAFTWFGAALAQAVVAMPFLVMILRVAFEAVDRDLEKAAQTEGASRWSVFWMITLPLAWQGLAAGCALAFARALGEFGATIIIAGNIQGKTRTLPLAIYSSLNEPGAEAQTIGLVCVAVALALMALVLSRAMSGGMFWKSGKPGNSKSGSGR